MMNTIVITGGHHSSALPVIDELKKRYPNINMYWFGHKKTLPGSKNTTLEFREIQELHIPFYDLKAGKFYRTFNPFRLIKIPVGFFQALFLLKKIKPDVILSFGGYLAVPVVLAGWLLGIPTVTHEQTVTAGYANKLISRLAKKVLCAWPQSMDDLPLEKAVLTGLPIRKEVFMRNNKDFNIQNRKPTIFITAGKTGSHIINLAVQKIMPDLLQIANVIHQAGDYSKYNDFDKLSEEYEKIKTKVEGVYYLRKYIFADTIGDAYGNASLVISRAGAHTCMEVMILGKPSILVPISWASHNEQYKNALMVKELGLAEIVNEDKIKDEKYFLQVIKEVLDNLEQYVYKQPFEKNLQAAKLIVDEIVKIL